MSSPFDRSYRYYAERTGTLLPGGIYEPALRKFLRKNAGLIAWLVVAIPSAGIFQQDASTLFFVALVTAGLASVFHRWINA